MNEKRNLNVEVLRCFAMVGVISLHFNSHGGILDATTPLSINWMWAYLLEALFFVSVPLFYLISSYYLFDSHITCERFIHRTTKLWVEVSFYSIVTFLFSTIFLNWDWTVNELLQVVFPVMFRGYGFFNSYLFLTLMAIPLSIFVNDISRKQHRIIIGVLIIVCSILPYISFNDVFWIGYGQGNLWLILIFLIGSYLKKYDCAKNMTQYRGHFFFIAVGAIMLTFLSKIIIAIVTRKIYGVVKSSSAFYGETPFLNLVAVCAFFMFSLCCGNRDRKKNNGRIGKIVSFFARNSFAVYLITDNNIIRKIIWPWLNLSRFANSQLYLLFAVYVLVVVSFFVQCAIIEEVRSMLDNKIHLSENISKKLCRFYEKLRNSTVVNYFLE